MKYSGFVFTFFLAFWFVAILIKPHGVPLNETYLKQVNYSQWIKQITTDSPQWMKNNFANISKENLSQDALTKTYETILTNTGSRDFVRYRIIGNQLYRFGKVLYKETHFEKALKTLTQLTHISDVDFIVSYMDGIPEPYMPQGFYLTENPKEQAPILSWAKLKDAKHVVLIPDWICLSKSWKEASDNVLLENLSWDQKKSAAFWRGATSDQGYNLTNFTEKPRYRLAHLSKTHPKIIDAGFNVVYPEEIMPAFKKEDLIKNEASYHEHLQYRYLPCMDGYMCTYPGFQWRLLSNSLTLKADSDAIQWFYSGLQENVHFISIHPSLDNFVEKVHWAEKNPKETQKIIQNATEFAKNYLLIEGQYYYLAQVLNQYAKHQKLHSDIINETKTSPDWNLIQFHKIPKLKQKFRLKRIF